MGAAIALERMATHEKKAAAHVAMSSASSDTPVHLAQNPRDQTEDAAMELLVDDTEQEVKLQLALRMDEAQILERENAELAEALLRSNLDASQKCGTDPSSSGLADGD